jgi:hypothetical protein
MYNCCIYNENEIEIFDPDEILYEFGRDMDFDPFHEFTKFELSDKTKTNKMERVPAKRCPPVDVIRVVQGQLFDNGSKPGRGRSQHTLKLEIYCEDKVELEKPYWWRSVALISPKLFIDWAVKARADGRLTAEQFEDYQRAHDVAKEFEVDDECEFAKLGHIGAERENVYYENQFVLALKTKGGGLQVLIIIDGDGVKVDKWWFNKGWKPGSKARKFFAIHDPQGLVAKTKSYRIVKDPEPSTPSFLTRQEMVFMRAQGDRP